MYASAFVLGFHGCDRAVGERILSGDDGLRPSANDYDWLGNGIYFWENSPQRAEHWAQFIKSHPNLFRTKITHPFVLGAIIDLGRCLDLMESWSLQQLKRSYEHMRRSFEVARSSEHPGLFSADARNGVASEPSCSGPDPVPVQVLPGAASKLA